MSRQPRIEWMPLSKVKRAPTNPRLHDDAAIVRSITHLGFVQPLLYDERTKRLVAGHGRLDALLSIQQSGVEAPANIRVRSGGEWEVPVIRGIAFADDASAEAYLLADNRIAELGGWDDAGLREVVARLAADGEVVLDALGWTRSALDRLLADTATPPPAKGKARAMADPDGDGLKAVTLYYPDEEYDGVVAQLRSVAKAQKLSGFAEVVRYLLDTHAPRPRVED